MIITMIRIAKIFYVTVFMKHQCHLRHYLIKNARFIKIGNTKLVVEVARKQNTKNEENKQDETLLQRLINYYLFNKKNK